MDIHRCRFVPYQPSTINVLAFSHTNIRKGHKIGTLRLAIGRANGDIEIWNPLNGSWLQETILRGGRDRSVDGLAWTQDPDEEDANGKLIVGKLRLFSIGYTTTVTEWDLEKGQPLRQSSGNHGEIWCLAAQPELPSATLTNDQTEGWRGQSLVTGCTDGAVVLYSTADEDLRLQRVLVRPSAKRAKIISIVFQSRDVVVAGCTDSTIRLYDIRNGSTIRSMSLGAGPSGGPKEIIVWSLKCLPNGNIVSGDSTGELRIWDGKTHTLIQRIKSHNQDVLSVAVSADGTSILSGGMDRRTVNYKQIGGAKSRWAEVSHKRFHSHDVKTMATFEGKGMSVVASGGPDTTPIILPLREYGTEHQRTLSHLPQSPLVQSASKQRLVVSFWDHEVLIWKILKHTKPTEDAYESENEAEMRNRKLVARIIVKGDESISSASISANGRLIAVSTSAETKIFSLKPRKSFDGEALKVSKIAVPATVSNAGARHVQFSPDSRWLCIVRNNHRVVAARICEAVDEDTGVATPMILPTLSKLERIDRQIEKRVLLGGLGAYERTINRVTFSSDSRILAASDLAGYIDTWVLEGSEDLTQPIDDSDDSDFASDDGSDSDDEEKAKVIFGQHWVRNPSGSLIPKLPAAPVVLSFRPDSAATLRAQAASAVPHPTRHNPNPVSHDVPAGEDRLLVVTATNKVFEFEVLRGALTPWSRRNPPASFPEKFGTLRDTAMGALWDLENNRERLWLYGSAWLFMFDLSRDIPVIKSTELTNGDAAPSKKRKRNVVDLRKNTTGAGSKVPDEENETGISRKMQRVIYDEEEQEETSWVGLDGDDKSDFEGFEDDVLQDVDADEMSALSKIRGEETKSEKEESISGPRNWWHTFKYRPIMGIVPLVEEGGLEVALVERPLWEIDMPPRYYGNQEWEKPGI